MNRIRIGRQWIGPHEPCYFIADMSANHDGDLDRAKELCTLAKKAGADAAKFQNFRAPKIVSQTGFESMAKQLSHQAKWKRPVFQVYQDASIPFEWTPVLKRHCDKIGIEYFSTPYDFAAVDMLEPYVPAYKIGSGDITWPELLEYVAAKGKPVLIATGASDLIDVRRAVEALARHTSDIVLMQCNTNYTGSLENFKHLNLNVLRTFARLYPGLPLGLSDHAPGHAAVLGAVALGARAVEKHFTDDTGREGPDHPFSMTPETWRDMVDRTRELEAALGDGEKVVEENEQDTVVVQRRAIRAAKVLPAGTVLRRDMLEVLRPAPRDGVFPYDLPRVVNRKLKNAVQAGQHLTWNDLDGAGAP